MKKYNKLFLALLVFLTVFSCQDEEIIKEGTYVEEGLPATINLSFTSLELQQIQTKSASLVQDLYVFIFKSDDGTLVDSHYFSASEVSAGNGVAMVTSTGRRHIYGVANLQTSAFGNIKEKLDKVANEQDLLDLSVELQDYSINSAASSFLMSGFYTKNDKALDPPVAIIQENGSVTTDEESDADVSTESAKDKTPKIRLKRLHSKITFDVTIGGEKVKSFIVDSFSVINVPKVSTLIELKDGETESTYFSARQQQTFNEGKNNFTFYMLENRLEPKKECSLYEDRETGSNGAKKIEEITWTNAPDNGTYVVLKGRYKGSAIKYTGEDNNRTEEGESQVDADVTYYIHLGYVGDKPSDFSSLRNKDYTYHVSVAGVDKIVLEVETNDKYDRGDGDVYYMDGGNVIEVDAHYAARVLSFTRKQLGGSNSTIPLKVLVNSNKTNGFEEKDMDWVKFVCGGEPDKPVCYPGDGDERLRSVQEFLSELDAFRKKSGEDDEKIYYTCFINEYYGESDDDWKDYVNQNDRIMQIICNFHTGNGSNTVDAAYIIRQKSIQSFYDINKVESAWGLEWINETTNYQTVGSRRPEKDKPIEIGLPYGTPKGTGNDFYNGRWNMMQEIGTNASWYQDGYIPKDNPNDELVYHAYSDDLNKAYAACMQRNRDADGNGKIDGDEIKWYLPALYQYTDISVGANVLPEKIQLYTTDDYNTYFEENNKRYWMFKHFISNTSKKVFWAEEGGPYGDLDSNRNGLESHLSNKVRVEENARQFRCVRNLGKNSSKEIIGQEDRPADFVKYGNNIMNLTWMNPVALRDAYVENEELAQHDERSYISRPYTKFQVAQNNVSVSNYVSEKGGAYSKRNGNYYFAGINQGSYIRSTTYFTVSNDRYFDVGPGHGEYMHFFDRTTRKSDGYYYYSTQRYNYEYQDIIKGKLGRYRKTSTGQFTLEPLSNGSYIDNYYVRSKQEYEYGDGSKFYRSSELEIEPKEMDFIKTSKNEGSPYIKKVGQGKGDYLPSGGNDYFYVGPGNGLYSRDYSGENGQYGWTVQNMQADRYHNSVCAEYSEKPDKSDKGTWRLPNLRELLLIKSRITSTSELMSRTYYSFYLRDMENLEDKIQNPNGSLSKYTKYSAGDGKSRAGFGLGTFVYLIDPSNQAFKVRCVKDVR